MTKEQLKKAVELNNQLEHCKEIKSTMSSQETSWWFFKTIDNEILIPDKLREKFSQAVDDSISELEKEMEKI